MSVGAVDPAGCGDLDGCRTGLSVTEALAAELAVGAADEFATADAGEIALARRCGSFCISSLRRIGQTT